MKRYLNDSSFKLLRRDFEFLFERIIQSHGELDFRVRDGYFNLYYKGNSLAKVIIKKSTYQAEVHHKFIPDEMFHNDKRFQGRGIRRGEYIVYHLDPDEVHPFFQVKYLDQIGRNIAQVNYGEEITFEHLLITDNLDREDLIILDRQVTETSLAGRRIDILAGKKVVGNRYQFLVVEVKLGNNSELQGAVIGQLRSYISHIESHFEDWKGSYENTYGQMKALGLFPHLSFINIELVDGVQGMVCVGGYTGMAKKEISSLKESFPEIQVQLFKNSIEPR